MSVEIKVHDNYKVVVDKYNWTSLRLGTIQDEEAYNYGEPTERPIAFSHDLGQALCSIIRDMTYRGEDFADVAGYLLWWEGTMDELTHNISSLKEELSVALELNKVL